MGRKPEDKPNEEPARYDEPWRARLAADLSAYRAEQEEVWGGIDELTLARYEAGVLPPGERERVEEALRDHPALRECLEIARELATSQDPPPVDDARRQRRGDKSWADRKAPNEPPDTEPGKSR